MCILTFVTRYCERFPLILIGNRDEMLARATGTLTHDPATGFVWAVDQLAGGSWMGIEPRSGRFAILTNCRRPPAAPLLRRDGPETSGAWRGAAPLSHITAHTAVVPVPPTTATPPSLAQGQAVTLTYNPPTSRGTLVKDFLGCGSVPGDVGGEAGSAAAEGPPAVVRAPPFYAGFNLLTCEDLRGEPAVAYTANRYGAEHRCPVAPGVVHALQNSFLDNTQAEPITDRLRQLFTDALAGVIDPLAAAEEKGPLAPDDVAGVATALVDACLCDRCDVDVAAIAATSAAVHAQLHATGPLLGFTAAELEELFGRPGSGAAPLVFTDAGAAEREAYLQSNIFKVPRGGYGTRVQSMVLVERVDASGTVVIHFCQRDVTFDAAAGRVVAAPWTTYRILPDGTCVREAGPE